MSVNEKKPIAYDIDDWSMKRIKYRCPRCRQIFNILTTEIKYCYHCGQPIKWDNIPLELPQTVTYMYAHQYEYNNIEQFTKELINSINTNSFPLLVN